MDRYIYRYTTIDSVSRERYIIRDRKRVREIKLN